MFKYKFDEAPPSCFVDAAEKDQAFIEGGFFTKTTGSETSEFYKLTPNLSSLPVEFENSAFTA